MAKSFAMQPSLIVAMLGLGIAGSGACIGLITVARLGITSISSFDPRIENSFHWMLLLGIIGAVIAKVAQILHTRETRAIENGGP